MLAFNERFRIAVLETVLRRNDREFVRRMELISGTLLPPSQREARPPLDDAAPIRARTTSTPPPTKSRVRRGLSWLRRSWHQVLAVGWAGCLVALGIGATTVDGTVVCAVAAGFLLGLVWHRALIRGARGGVVWVRSLLTPRHRSRSPLR